MKTSVVMNEKYTNGAPTVENLRKQGYKVRVYHGRRWDTRDGLCACEDVLSKKDMSARARRDMGSLVNCFGGFTRVELTDLNGRTATGKYNFGNRQFNRKIGLQAAIGRALATLGY